MTPSNRLHTLVASLAALSMAGAGAPDPIMGPGVSRELATERAANISGIRYGLPFVRRVARHGVAVRSLYGSRARQAADVVVDFRGPRLANVAVNDRTVNTTFNGMHLRFPPRRFAPARMS